MRCRLRSTTWRRSASAPEAGGARATSSLPWWPSFCRSSAATRTRGPPHLRPTRGPQLPSRGRGSRRRTPPPLAARSAALLRETATPRLAPRLPAPVCRAAGVRGYRGPVLAPHNPVCLCGSCTLNAAGPSRVTLPQSGGHGRRKGGLKCQTVAQKRLPQATAEVKPRAEHTSKLQARPGTSANDGASEGQRHEEGLQASVPLPGYGHVASRALATDAACFLCSDIAEEATPELELPQVTTLEYPFVWRRGYYTGTRVRASRYGIR